MSTNEKNQELFESIDKRNEVKDFVHKVMMGYCTHFNSNDPKEIKKNITEFVSEYGHLAKGKEHLSEHIRGKDIGDGINSLHDVKQEAKDLLNDAQDAVLKAKFNKMINLGESSEGKTVYNKEAHIFSSTYAIGERDQDTIAEIYSVIKDVNKDFGGKEPFILTFDFNDKLEDISGLDVDSKEGTFKLLVSERTVKDAGKDLDKILETIDERLESAPISTPFSVKDDLKDVPIYKRQVDKDCSFMNETDWSELSSKQKGKVYEAFNEEPPSKAWNKKALSMKL